MDSSCGSSTLSTVCILLTFLVIRAGAKTVFSDDIPTQGPETALQTSHVPTPALHSFVRCGSGRHIFRGVFAVILWASCRRSVHPFSHSFVRILNSGTDYAAKTWKYRWWLLDGWLALLFLVAFALIAYLWRPSANNRRYVVLDSLLRISTYFFLLYLR